MKCWVQSLALHKPTRNDGGCLYQHLEGKRQETQKFSQPLPCYYMERFLNRKKKKIDYSYTKSASISPHKFLEHSENGDWTELGPPTHQCAHFPCIDESTARSLADTFRLLLQ